MDSFINLRKKLHQNAELAFQEKNTVKILIDFLQDYKPDEIINPIGKSGVAFIFKRNETKPKIMFRADLDALPIEENQNKDYVSIDKSTSHMCGHDGHMAMVASIASEIKDLQNIGDIILLFQPAEEIGAGAKACLEDPIFSKLKVDYIFGLHNLPEIPLGEFVIKNGCFACSSVGLKVNIKGESAHAAHPEQVQSPLLVFNHLSEKIDSFNNFDSESFFISTLTHLKLGEESFGITPGDLTFFLTLRSASDHLLEKNKKEIVDHIFKSFSQAFEISIKEEDYFPATINHDSAYAIVQNALVDAELNYQVIDEPLRWSEDFGYFTQKMSGCYFGLGMGTDFPLHHSHYDFNDKVISFGTKLYLKIIEKINHHLL